MQTFFVTNRPVRSLDMSDLWNPSDFDRNGRRGADNPRCGAQMSGGRKVVRMSRLNRVNRNGSHRHLPRAAAPAVG